MVKALGPRMIGADSESESKGQADGQHGLCGDSQPHSTKVYANASSLELINPEHVRHIFVSPRRRAQRTAELVSR